MKENLEKMGLQSLRIYAKQKGVKSPSSFSKYKLIEKILDIENGKTTPYFTKRGRPSNNNLITEKDQAAYKEKIKSQVKLITGLTIEYLYNLTKLLDF